MKVLQVITGILSIAALITAIATLVNQPFKQTVDNDRAFAALFYAFLLFTLIAMTATRILDNRRLKKAQLTDLYDTMY